MLLIGSRAIVLHFPDFRAPKDWDLIATPAEIDRLREVLEPLELPGGSTKPTFRYDGAMLEVASTGTSEYWAHVYDLFANEPQLDVPQLGRLRVAPAAYLLLTKQCGLVYHTAHWHKNLEDLYFLRDRIPVISDQISALLPLTLADSADMFGERHAKQVIPMSCHPGAKSVYDARVHRELHRRLALGERPCVDAPDAWQSFPKESKDKRQAQMRLLLAEEAMVLASERLRELGLVSARQAEHAPRAAGQGVEGAAPQHHLPQEAELITWALRMLTTGSLPLGWRYFGINHFREIQQLIPAGWSKRLGELASSHRDYALPCGVPSGCAAPRERALRRAASGAQSLPALTGQGSACGEVALCEGSAAQKARP